MDAKEFLTEKERMCKDFDYCKDCPLGRFRPCFAIHCAVSIAKYPDDAIHVVEQWSLEHPLKTRQLKFLDQWPRAHTDGGAIDLKPCFLDESLFDIRKCKGADCDRCRREFWTQPIQ